MSLNSRTNACFVKDLKHTHWENAHFFHSDPVCQQNAFQEKHQSHFICKFHFSPPESLNLHCWQKFLSSASNHCINKSRFVNHDLGCLQMHFVIFHSILQEENLTINASILILRANTEGKGRWCQSLLVQHIHWMSLGIWSKCGTSQVFPQQCKPRSERRVRPWGLVKPCRTVVHGSPLEFYLWITACCLSS